MSFDLVQYYGTKILLIVVFLKSSWKDPTDVIDGFHAALQQPEMQISIDRESSCDNMQA